MSDSAHPGYADRLVEIGVMGRPHGVLGEMRAFLYNPESRLLELSKQIFLKTDKELRRYNVRDIRRTARCHLLTVEGVKSRKEAETLKSAKLCIARDDFPKPEPDQFYVVDLIDLEAWDSENFLGRISSSREQGGVEVVTVTGEDEEIDVPIVEDFVTTIDFENGRLMLHDSELLPRTKVRGKRIRG